MNILQWFIKRFDDNKIIIGYYFWMGIPFIALIFKLIGQEISYWFVIPIHFIGLFLVAKYHWFAFQENVDMGENDG